MHPRTCVTGTRMQRGPIRELVAFTFSDTVVLRVATVLPLTVSLAETVRLPVSFLSFDFLRVKRQVAPSEPAPLRPCTRRCCLPLRLTVMLSLPVLPGMYLTTSRRPIRAMTGFDSAGTGFGLVGLLGGSIGMIGSGTSGFGVGVGRLTDR